MKKLKIPEWDKTHFVKWRSKLGLTQHEAAELLGYRNRASVCNLELGRSTITPRIVMACLAVERGLR